MRRTSRRLALRRAFTARALSARVASRSFVARARRYTAVVGRRLLSNSASAAARVRFLVALAQGNAYTSGRTAVTQRQYRVTRRTSRASRPVRSAFLKPTVRTAPVSARGVRQQLLQYVTTPKILQNYQQLIVCRQRSRFTGDSSPRRRVYALTSGASTAARSLEGQPLRSPAYSASNIRLRKEAQYSI